MYSNGHRKWRNSKLETFLRRNLKASVYGDIRWHEPVVLRKGINLEYKQVVVTGEVVLMVDTAPKTVSTLFNISNITSVLLVHDLPQFLEGGLRDQTTHILLKVRNENHKLHKSYSFTSSKISISRRQSLNSIIVEESEDENEFEDSKTTLDLEKMNKIFEKRTFLRSSSLDLLCFSTNNSDLNMTEESRVKHNKTRPPLTRSVARDDYQASSIVLERSQSNGCLTAEGPELNTSPRLTPKPPDELFRPFSPALTELLTRVDGYGRPCLEGRASTPDIPNLSRQVLPRSFSALEHYHEPSHFHLHNSFRSKSVLDKPSGIYNMPYVKRDSSVTESSTQDSPENIEEIHLYSLSTSTHLYHLLHSLWMASLLSPERSSMTVSNPDLNLDEERFRKSVSEICSALRQVTTLEDEFSLLQELRTGVRDYPSVRRLFWKDKECRELVQNILRKYCTATSGQISMSMDEDFETRENELALLVLAYEVLANALASSQGCPCRAKSFRSKNTVESLLKDSFTPPDLPAPQKLTCKRFLSNFKELSTMTWELLPERELVRLTQSVINESVVVAFYIIEAIFELGWSSFSKRAKHTTPSNEIDSMTLHLLMQHIPTEEWLSYAIPQLFFLIHAKPRTSEEGLSGSEVILIYQYLGVLLAMFKQNTKSLAYCVTNFSEEIRYYVSEATLKRKIEPTNPLRSHTLRIAQTFSKLFYTDRGRKKKFSH